MKKATIHKIGIIMNGVTGRMGTNQHLIRSIKAIIDQGGVKLSDAEVIMPDPVLVGRSEDKLKALGANYVQGGLWRSFAVRDGNLVTGQQNFSGAETARLVIEALGR